MTWVVAPVSKEITLTVLSPSPAQTSLWPTTITPSGPDVSLFPVKPANGGFALSWVDRVLVPVSTTSTALFVRSARKYSPITGSTKLMSNLVMSWEPGSVIWLVGANTSSDGFSAAAGPPASSKADPAAVKAARKYFPNAVDERLWFLTL